MPQAFLCSLINAWTWHWHQVPMADASQLPGGSEKHQWLHLAANKCRNSRRFSRALLTVSTPLAHFSEPISVHTCAKCLVQLQKQWHVFSKFWCTLETDYTYLFHAISEDHLLMFFLFAKERIEKVVKVLQSDVLIAHSAWKHILLRTTDFVQLQAYLCPLACFLELADLFMEGFYVTVIVTNHLQCSCFCRCRGWQDLSVLGYRAELMSNDPSLDVTHTWTLLACQFDLHS